MKKKISRTPCVTFSPISCSTTQNSHRHRISCFLISTAFLSLFPRISCFLISTAPRPADNYFFSDFVLLCVEFFQSPLRQKEVKIIEIILFQSSNPLPVLYASLMILYIHYYNPLSTTTISYYYYTPCHTF